MLKEQAKDVGSSTASLPTPSISHDNYALPDARFETFNGNVSDFIATSTPTNQSYEDRSNPPFPTSAPSAQITNYSPDDGSRQLMWGAWPPRLPSPDLLLHLIDLFFTCHPHAHYLLHRPTFMASLTYPPRSPGFPQMSVLHAICAYASVFSPRVETPPIDTKGAVFSDRDRNTADSFAGKHVRWSRQARDEANILGENLIESIQCKYFKVIFTC
jgi:hypothetical protein